MRELVRRLSIIIKKTSNKEARNIFKKKQKGIDYPELEYWAT